MSPFRLCKGKLILLGITILHLCFRVPPVVDFAEKMNSAPKNPQPVLPKDPITPI